MHRSMTNSLKSKCTQAYEIWFNYSLQDAMEAERGFSIKKIHPPVPFQEYCYLDKVKETSPRYSFPICYLTTVIRLHKVNQISKKMIYSPTKLTLLMLIMYIIPSLFAKNIGDITPRTCLFVRWILSAEK